MENFGCKCVANFEKFLIVSVLQILKNFGCKCVVNLEEVIDGLEAFNQSTFSSIKDCNCKPF